MVDSTLNIHSLIPQRPPFVMVDSLLHYDEQATRTSLLVTPGNILVENGQFSEAGLVENIAQTAAARAGYVSITNKQPVLVGYIGSVKNLEIFHLPVVNDRLETEVTVENQVFDVTVIKGRVWCGQQLVAQCEMKIFISQPK